MSKQTKSAAVTKMLGGTKGTTIAAICKKTGWKRHTVHAFLSGLRQSGAIIERQGRDKDATYRLASSPEAVE